MSAETQLYGLVVCGGQSSRMGVDKSRLIYRQKEQRFEVYDMLKNLCDEVIISCNNEQIKSTPSHITAIADNEEYDGIGPIAALLTAFDKFQDHDFLVVGIDYPFLTAADLEHFITNTKRNGMAAAFYNTEGFYEPLLSWYSKNCGNALRQMFKNGEYSLQRFLRDHRTERYIPVLKQVTYSSDTMENYEKAKSFIATGASIGNFKVK